MPSPPPTSQRLGVQALGERCSNPSLLAVESPNQPLSSQHTQQGLTGTGAPCGVHFTPAAGQLSGSAHNSPSDSSGFCPALSHPNDARAPTPNLSESQGSRPSQKTFNSGQISEQGASTTEEGGSTPANVSFTSQQPSSLTAFSMKTQEKERSITLTAERNTAPQVLDSQAQLARLGYKQELNRRWDFWGALSLEYCSYGPCNFTFTELNSCMKLGGPPIMIWGFLGTAIFNVLTHAVMAELTSAMPVSGGTFTWTFRLARANPRCRKYARVLSWIVGSYYSLSQIMLQIEPGREFSNLTTEILLQTGVVKDTPLPRSILISYIFFGVCSFLTLLPIVNKPQVWRILGAVAACLHITLCILIVSTTRHWRPLSSLFLFSNFTSITNMTWLIFRAWARSTLLWSSDPAIHMAEETVDAAVNVPRAVFYGCLSSQISALLSNICFTLALPMDRYTLPTLMPLLSMIYRQFPKPVGHTIAVSLLFLGLLQNVVQVMSAGRFFWALARDQAFPFAKVLSKVTKQRLPLRAVLTVGIVSSAIYSMAFAPTLFVLRTVAPAGSDAIIIAYFIPCAIYIFSQKDALTGSGRHAWTLHGYGRPISAVICLFFLMISIIWAIPLGSESDLKAYPWSPVVSVAILVLALFTWFIYGRSHYAGPVKSLTMWTAGHEVEVPRDFNKRLRLKEPEACYQGSKKIRETTKFDNGRSAANMTGHQSRTFNVPQTYQTYRSQGSMWDSMETGEETSNYSHFE